MPPSLPRERDDPPSYRTAAAVSGAVFLLYLATLAPSTAMWDTSEYLAAAYTLGIPHPPGNPMFILMGRVFAILPIASSVAVRINVLAALASAIAAGAWFLVAERVLRDWIPTRAHRRLGAAVAAGLGATAFTVWNQSVVNEKVYTVSLMGIAIASWLMVRWSDQPDGRKADRLLVLVAYLLGLGYAVHMGGMLAAPAMMAVVLIRRPRTILRWRLLFAAAATMLLGLTPFATQPIRAAFNPAINEGDPTACRTGLAWRCTFSSGTYRAFADNFNRTQYAKGPLWGTQPDGQSARQAPFTAQVGMWWFYFKWQWVRDLSGSHALLQGLAGALFLVLGLWGGWMHFQRDRHSFWYFGVLIATTTLVLIFYLNFKYGASQAPELGGTVDREVRDRDYFYLWSFSAWGVWAGLGLIALWESLALLISTGVTNWRNQQIVSPPRRAWQLSSVVLLVALVPVVANWRSATRAGETDARDFAADLLNSTEPYGVLVTVGDNDTFPLWYAQEVEGIRRDVVVANTSLLGTDWYPRELIQRPIYEYDAAKGPALYRDHPWVRPTTPPLHMTLDEADSVPAYYLVREPLPFQAGAMTVNLDPRALPQAQCGAATCGVLQRADAFVLRMIQDSFPGRSINFARTSAGYARQLGLADRTITQGLADKLFIPGSAMGADTVYVQNQGWFDIARSKQLWTEVFRSPDAIIRKGRWVDGPSRSIPYLVAATGFDLGAALEARGDSAASLTVRRKASTVARVAGLDAGPR